MDVFYFDKTLKRTDKIERKSNIWIDITDIDERKAQILKDSFDLHPLTVEDLISDNARIKVEEFNKYLFCVFYGIEKTKKGFQLIELDFIVGKDFIISNHKKKIDTIENLKDRQDKVGQLIRKGPDFVFHRLLDKEIDDFFPVLENLDEEIEEIEDNIIRKPDPNLLNKVMKFKRTIIQIKRTGFQQREKISYLAKNDYKFISKKAVPYFRDIYDHAIRVSDTIDNYREAIGETFDAYMSAVNNSMNEVMKTLSIIATIAMPLTVISGIYGTNFTNLPGSSFRYGFWMMITAMIFLSFSIIFFFRKRKWF